MDIRPSVVLLLRIVLIQLLAAKPNKSIIIQRVSANAERNTKLGLPENYPTHCRRGVQNLVDLFRFPHAIDKEDTIKVRPRLCKLSCTQTDRETDCETDRDRDGAERKGEKRRGERRGEANRPDSNY